MMFFTVVGFVIAFCLCVALTIVAFASAFYGSALNVKKESIAIMIMCCCAWYALYSFSPFSISIDAVN